MALKLKDKEAIVAELTEVASTALSAVAADYRGLTVSEVTELRKSARKNGVLMRVYRNTLARRAIKGTPFACLHEVLVGPLVLLFSTEEPGAAARLLRDFVKEHEALEVRALVLGGELLGADQLKAVASLPSREEALAQLVSVMQAPITKFVRTLNEPVAQVVRVMGQVRDQRQAA
ncbi:50S ribosomal protein L10 [Candidiatus Paracoxiella cheracis]|uniref:50S ribosomal protein L10 n=1 Tax=Candidiatus Paracoxiella cheracis TaxID=3405120 RepID=UPI003BF6120A